MNEQMGFVVGFVAAIFAVMIVKRIMYRRKGKMPEYDEMQKIIQGMAYKYGFLTVIATVAVCSVLDMLDIHLFADGATPMFLVLFLGVSVFAGYSIWKEAYFGLRTNENRYARFLIVIMVINLISGIQNLRGGKMLTNGRLNYTCVNLGCAVLLIVMLIIMYMKKHQREAEE